jgi:precorrin-2 dehydrogenase/sirohydrochlorin ferrochelatase
MIPIALDPRCVRLAVCGNGPLALRRFNALQAAGATDLLLFADEPLPALQTAAGEHWRPRLPDPADLADLHGLWIVDLAAAKAEPLAEQARARHLLVNIEDVPAFCDFHSVAEIRRGDLLLTISTGGAAPGLAGLIRRRLEAMFDGRWAERLVELRALRASWRAQNVPMPEAMRRIETLVAERGWLDAPEK